MMIKWVSVIEKLIYPIVYKSTARLYNIYLSIRRERLFGTLKLTTLREYKSCRVPPAAMAERPSRRPRRAFIVCYLFMIGLWLGDVWLRLSHRLTTIFMIVTSYCVAVSRLKKLRRKKSFSILVNFIKFLTNFLFDNIYCICCT